MYTHVHRAYHLPEYWPVHLIQYIRLCEIWNHDMYQPWLSQFNINSIMHLNLMNFIFCFFLFDHMLYNHTLFRRRLQITWNVNMKYELGYSDNYCTTKLNRWKQYMCRYSLNNAHVRHASFYALASFDVCHPKSNHWRALISVCDVLCEAWGNVEN